MAENEGVPPDIDVAYDARGVQEALKLLESEGVTAQQHPPFPAKARRPAVKAAGAQ